MQTFNLARRATAEGLGTGLLVATVVGSGIMAENLTRDVALQLLGNTLPTGAILVVLITILGPISGAHFNPVVTLAFAWLGDFKWRDVFPYLVAQVAGSVIGGCDRPRDVRPVACGILDQDTDGYPKLVCRDRRDIRPACNYSGWNSF